MRALILIAVLSAPIIDAAEAGERSYNCDVANIYHLEETGILSTATWASQFIGSSFSVSRSTGKVTGEVLPTRFAKSYRVINHGSAENSFKAVAEFAGQFQLLEIQEFREDVKKPFIASSMGGAGIVTGTCE